mmetsp:Transcript_36273/g.39345  ORF Transcript_36273/g.39345 Transcript_36273/m.39345 type:complete len:138 (+) Transcript_36273:73-486(+)
MLFPLRTSLSFLVVITVLAFGTPTLTEEERLNGDASSYGDTTREAILQTRERRKRQLKVMILDARKQLADHSAGEKILTMEQKGQFEHKIDTFQRKLDSMLVDLEEWEIERLVVRETDNANRRHERSQDSRRVKTEF